MRLAAEPGLEGLVAGKIVAKGLHADDAVETNVAGPENLGHAAAPDDAVELIAAAQQPGLCHVSHLRYRPELGDCGQHGSQYVVVGSGTAGLPGPHHGCPAR